MKYYQKQSSNVKIDTQCQTSETSVFNVKFKQFSGLLHATVRFATIVKLFQLYLLFCKLLTVKILEKAKVFMGILSYLSVLAAEFA